MEIGSRWLVALAGAEVDSDSERLVLQVPYGAFGSGEHETTRSCLEVLEELPGIEGARVLDVGSGTGILAVAALAAGAAEACCVDPDPGAAVTCRRMGELNGVPGHLHIVLGHLDALRCVPCGLVLANLYGDVLLDIGRDLTGFLAPGAHLVLSGIASEYAFDVRELVLGQGCTKVRETWLDEYVTMVFLR